MPLPETQCPIAAPDMVRDAERLAALRASGLRGDTRGPELERIGRVAGSCRPSLGSGGLPAPLATTRQLTGPTLCHHTIAVATPDAPLVIDDTARDPRYRDVPTVRSLGVAAYIGVPLLWDGQAIGA